MELVPDKSTDFFLRSVPTKEDDRKKWITAIEAHQQFDHKAAYFEVCELHFDSDCINRGKSQKLKSGSIPSTFPSAERHVSQVLSQSIQLIHFFIFTSQNSSSELIERIEPTLSITHVQKMRYCRIKNCRYAKGTLDKAVLYFR